MEEIKVGDFVRSKSGVIGKVIGIHTIEKYKYHYISTFVCYETEDITKHSPNIIDLIEVGDYVNGELVASVGDGRVEIGEGHTLSNEKIESVVTKEQFNSMKYIVKE